jgi:hypothetical protein
VIDVLELQKFLRATASSPRAIMSWPPTMRGWYGRRCFLVACYHGSP